MNRLYTLAIVPIVAIATVVSLPAQADALQLSKKWQGSAKWVPPFKRKCPLPADNIKIVPYWCSCRWLLMRTDQAQYGWPCRCVHTMDNVSKYCGCQRYKDIDLDSRPIAPQPEVMCPMITPDAPTPSTPSNNVRPVQPSLRSTDSKPTPSNGSISTDKPTISTPPNSTPKPIYMPAPTPEPKTYPSPAVMPRTTLDH